MAKEMGKYGHLQTLIMDMEHLSISQVSNKPCNIILVLLNAVRL